MRERPEHRRRPHAERTAGPVQLPAQEIRLRYKPTEILSADEVEAIHQASLTILKEIGVNFLLPEAKEILRRNGATVDPESDRVRFDPALIETLVAKAPSQFTLHARNPAQDRVIGGDHVTFCTVGGAPNYSDLQRGRRTGCFADYCDILKLSQQINAIHLIAGYPLEPVDLDPAIRHLVAGKAAILMTDKPNFGVTLGRRRILDMIEMARIAHGISEAELRERPVVYANVNANSPLQYDKPMLWGMIEMATRGQPVIVTPFTLAGAMAPVTIIGALAQQNAEALAGIAFMQMVRPGAPAIYGAFTSNVDLRSGAPAFGTPEQAQAAIISGQLIRRYRLPYRSSNVNAANAPDAQAAYESMMSLWSAVMGGANIVVHAAGWMEGGLCASLEKFIIDVETLQMMTCFLNPPTVDAGTLGLDAIREVGPGSHFFGAQHTMERYQTAFYAPLISDRRSEQAWRDAGAPDTAQRANQLGQRFLREYQEPAIADESRAALEEFVARRISKGGAVAED
jgi:trimethylamine--corrinoid protein Co-methyltransferase